MLYFSSWYLAGRAGGSGGSKLGIVLWHCHSILSQLSVLLHLLCIQEYCGGCYAKWTDKGGALPALQVYPACAAYFCATRTARSVYLLGMDNIWVSNFEFVRFTQVYYTTISPRLWIAFSHHLPVTEQSNAFPACDICCSATHTVYRGTCIIPALVPFWLSYTEAQRKLIHLQGS